MVALEQLTGGERAALVAIVKGDLAWSPVLALVAAGHALETLASLGAAGLVEPWDLPDGLVLTLTPYGAALLRVVIVERVRVVGGELAEDPRWHDDPAPELPIRLPRHAREVRDPFPERHPDPRPGPEYLLDEVTEQPVLLFGSVPVLIDPRLTKRVVRKRGRRRVG